MKGWEKRPVGEIADHCLGKMLDKRKNRGSLRPYLRNTNVRWFGFDLSDVNEMRFLPEEAGKFTTKKGDVMICEGGYPGRAAIWDCDDSIYFQKAIHRVRFHEPERNKWFVYYLYACDLDGSLSQHFTGAGIQHFTGKALARFELPLPPLAEQRRIVGILDDAFAGIATAKANAEKNLKNARAVFESYLNATFTKGGVGWIEKEMGEIVTFQGGSQPPKAVFKSKSMPGYLRLIQIRDYKTDKYAVYIPKNLAKRFCSADDVMIGRYGPPLFQILRGIEGAYNVALMKATPDESQLSKDLLFYFLKNTRLLTHIIHSSSRAAGQIGLNKSTLEKYPIIYPPTISEQSKLVKRLQFMLQETENLQAIYQSKIEALEELKRSLLHQAFSGQL